MQTRITRLLGIRHPLLCPGMTYVSNASLVAAVSNAGGLGQIGSGSMYPDVLREHIQKCKAHTDKPFAVNVPLLYPDIDKHIQIIIEEKVPIVFTSAGSPKVWTKTLQDHDIKVVHVTASSILAKKCEDAGVDAIVAEGFEAGGHNGREETTTLCLIPSVREAVNLPVIAAGGIASGKAMLAAMVLGADAVQIGTRFVCSEESSAHPAFKDKVASLKEGDTKLSMKKVVPVRLIKNEFYKLVQQAEDKGADASDLMELLGRARAKKGMFEGDMEQGELEIGQIAATIHQIIPASAIVREIWAEFLDTKSKIAAL